MDGGKLRIVVRQGRSLNRPYLYGAAAPSVCIRVHPWKT